MKKLLIFISFIIILTGCNNLNQSNDQVAQEPNISLQNPNTSINETAQNNETIEQTPPLSFDETTQETESSGQGTTTAIQNKNIIVPNPKMNEVTYEIAEKLIGRYSIGKVPNGDSEKYIEEYFEIMPDGTLEISIATFDGAAKYGADQLLLTAFYSDYWTIITFNLVDGCIHTFPSALSINFVGDFECTYFYSYQLSDDYNIQFVKQD